MKKLLLNSLLSVVTVNLVFTATIGFADSKRGKSFSFGGNSSKDRKAHV